MTTIVSLALFAGFLGTGILIVAAGRISLPGLTRRRAIHGFIAVALTGYLIAGLAQREFWPFSAYALLSIVHPAEASQSRIVALDSAGREHDIDYRAWQPFVFDELAAWVDLQLPRLDPERQQEAAAYLLDLAEAGRRRAREGVPPGTFDRYLGPLTAPYFLLHPKRWETPSSTPELPFTGLRVYRESWGIEERHSGDSSTERVLVFEHPHGD